jgi:TRL-like protein family
MLKRWGAALIVCLALGSAGCQPVAAPMMGMLYLDVKGPITATGETGTREGQACAKTILGLVATGDASIEAAMKAGGITKISVVDHHSTSTLGIIAEFCTIVRGS